MQYIIFDLEATCWPKEEPQHKGKPGEIIEIGAVKVNDALETVDAFQCFVKPTKIPVLSDFCTELTSITQRDVEDAPYFAEAMTLFEEWIDGDSQEGTVLLSWGHYDKGQINTESEMKNYNGKILELLENHRSLKHDFAIVRSVKRCGMQKALTMLNIPLDGTHHRGIDDALNITKIFKAVYNEWRMMMR